MLSGPTAELPQHEGKSPACNKIKTNVVIIEKDTFWPFFGWLNWVIECQRMGLRVGKPQTLSPPFLVLESIPYSALTSSRCMHAWETILFLFSLELRTSFKVSFCP